MGSVNPEQASRAPGSNQVDWTPMGYCHSGVVMSEALIPISFRLQEPTRFPFGGQNGPRAVPPSRLKSTLAVCSSIVSW